MHIKNFTIFSLIGNKNWIHILYYYFKIIVRIMEVSLTNILPYFDINIKISTLIFVIGLMNIKTKIRAFPTIPNKNICVPIGSMLAVQYFYEKLNFSDVFGKHKSRGLDLNSLLIGLVSYKLTENFSVKEASK